MIRRFRDQYLSTAEQRLTLAVIVAIEAVLVVAARLLGKRLRS